MTAAADAGHQTVSHDWDRALVPGPDGETARPEPDCPVEIAPAAIGGRWPTLVLRNLLHGPRSFGDLRRNLPSLSAKMLAERLDAVRARGLVERTRHAGFPVRTEYRVTAPGRRSGTHRPSGTGPPIVTPRPLDESVAR